MGKYNFSNIPKEFNTSSQPLAIKFLKFAKDAFGMDFSTGPTTPLTNLLVDWKEENIKD